MIVNTLDRWQQYPLGRAWEKAFAFLNSLSSEIAVGRHAIDGANLFAEVAEYTTAPAEAKHYEAHRTYMDLQCLIRGTEWLGYSPLQALTEVQPYNPERDFALYARPLTPTAHITLGNRLFIALYPEDGHCPGIAYEATPMPVKKVVVKIRVGLLAGR